MKRVRLISGSCDLLSLQPISEVIATVFAVNSKPRNASLSNANSAQRADARSGIAAVEFALVAPLFLLLVFALIEFGRMMMVQQSLTNAAREGCRTAILATTINSSDVEAAVRDYLQSVMSNATDAGEVRVTVPASLAAAASGTELSVSIDVDYSDVSWLPLGYLGLNPTIAVSQTGQRE